MGGYYRLSWPCWACVTLATQAQAAGRAIPCWICGRVHGRDQDWALRQREDDARAREAEARAYSEGCRP